MDKELVTGIIASIVIAAIGIVFLYLATTGVIPTGFGLFNMENLGTRAIVFIILVIIVAVLAVVYFRGRKEDDEEGVATEKG